MKRTTDKESAGVSVLISAASSSAVLSVIAAEGRFKTSQILFAVFCESLHD
jgi:hypothetical protein